MSDAGSEDKPTAEILRTAGRIVYVFSSRIAIVAEGLIATAQSDCQPIEVNPMCLLSQTSRRRRSFN
jgi:hypothetical protein